MEHKFTTQQVKFTLQTFGIKVYYVVIKFAKFNVMKIHYSTDFS